MHSYTGGGQPSDTGALYIEGERVFTVNFAVKNGNIVEHIGDFVSHPIELLVGQSVEVEVDAAKRVFNARLHSAGHAIDTAIARNGLASLLKATKGYHFPDGPYVEYETKLADAELAGWIPKLNASLKDIILEDIPSKTFTLSKAEAQKLFADEMEGYPEILRVVNVAQLPCPCGGTHVNSTSELIGISITKVKVKKGVVKVSYLLV